MSTVDKIGNISSMKFIIEPKIFEHNRDLKLGVITIKGINNSKRISAVESLLRGVAAQKGKYYSDKDIHAEPMIKVWEQAYSKFDINPKKYLPSISALLKRVAAGKDIPHINPLVDLYNYFSLKELLPIGSEDLDWLCGDLRLTYTKGGEPFRPIGSIEVKSANEGEVAYMDEAGITCKYWNHRECERTKLTPKTVNAAIFIEDLSKMPRDVFTKKIEEVGNAILKYMGGKVEMQILDEENRIVDFGIQGRKNMNDAKIPAQEKAHHMQLASQKQTKSEEIQPNAIEVTLPQNHDLSPRPAKAIDLGVESPELLKNQIKQLTETALLKAYKLHREIKIEYPAQREHGDYATNIALVLSKELEVGPREIAEHIVNNFPDNDLIQNMEIAGPGFINFFINESTLSAEIFSVLEQKEAYGNTLSGKDKPLIIEYCSPNIAKPLGVHHLLTTVIGQSLANITEKLGFNTIKINHIGDYGTQFGKLLYAYKNWGSKEKLEAHPIEEMLKLYVKFHEEAEKTPEIEDIARQEFKIFEDGDFENIQLWKWFVDESMKEINQTLEKLGGIKFDYNLGESFYQDKMDPILREGKEKGIFVKGEEGAFIAEFDDPNLGTAIIQKKDGATLYLTRDLATIKYRIEEWHPVKILYVVDIAQTLHFKQLFKIAERFPWYHGEGEHVWFGRMSMKDSKMSTRKGNVVLLDDLINEAEQRALKIIEEKSPNLKGKEKTAHIVGIGAIKYNILSQNRTTNIVFDWDKMLSFDGNSGPYLQYTYARGKSILRKSEEVIGDSLPDAENTDILTRNLVGLFPKFKEFIALSAKDYKPNHLCGYLYELAQNFNSYYNSIPVLRTTDEKRIQRLKIIEATCQILKNGLALLGIEVVDEM